MADSSSPPQPSSPGPRIGYRGSCHCGAVRYIVFLTLPHAHPPEGTSKAVPLQRIYRCNCSTCHKMGQFHIRPKTPAEDFLLLSPLDPDAKTGAGEGGGEGDGEGLGVYTCYSGRIKFYFCKTCGCRPFLTSGVGEVEEVDLSELRLAEKKKNKKKQKTTTNQTNQTQAEEESEGGKVKAWRLKPNQSRLNSYLSVNGVTVDTDQQGFDLREFSEKNWLLYLDCLHDEGKPGFEPHEGGCY